MMINARSETAATKPALRDPLTTHRHAIPTPQANFLSRAIPSFSKPLDQCFTLCPVEIEIPCAVRKHLLSGIKPENPRTWLIAVHDAALGVGQDDPGNVPVEQQVITLFPPTLSLDT